MPRGPLRRAQLIAPFGVGAMVVVRDGTSLVAAGLDHWYQPERPSSDARQIQETEFTVEEWRLQRLLRVHHFRLPPDYRRAVYGQESPNCYLTIPFLRFPQWHFCPRCYRLYEFPLTARGRQFCVECAQEKRRERLVQVPFVAMCDRGHLQDFPWNEWVHRSRAPTCAGPIRLVATGGATLGAQMVRCDCGAERSLANITTAAPDGSTTFVSDNLCDDGQTYLCQGKRVWLGLETGEDCPRPLRGTLRNAANVYYADVRSSIYLPRGTDVAPSQLVSLLERPPLSTLISLLSDSSVLVEPVHLRGQHGVLLEPFSDEQIRAALRLIASERNDPPSGQESQATDEDPWMQLRRAEYSALTSPRADDDLVVRPQDPSEYGSIVSEYFASISLVEKLRETRAFSGFSRVFPDSDLDLEQRKAMLRREPTAGQASWLPACLVYGEGIFLEVRGDRLTDWERRDDVANRFRPLVERYSRLQARRRLRERDLSPRFVLLHTLAHLVINQLTFDCGYSSAALRERLYVSDSATSQMAGILIYTAAGDTEGTLGGLVAMGSPDRLGSALRRALEGARWCSADPVCMEIGETAGQGPDSCNLAACHNCALVPETACEEFNRFLDRGLVIGTPSRKIGFFE